MNPISKEEFKAILNNKRASTRVRPQESRSSQTQNPHQRSATRSPAWWVQTLLPGKRFQNYRAGRRPHPEQPLDGG